jgi:transcriptional regulator with XRE-family HTH domain
MSFGISIIELAKEMGVTRSYLTHIVKGNCMPHFFERRKIPRKHRINENETVMQYRKVIVVTKKNAELLKEFALDLKEKHKRVEKRKKENELKSPPIKAVSEKFAEKKAAKPTTMTTKEVPFYLAGEYAAENGINHFKKNSRGTFAWRNNQWVKTVLEKDLNWKLVK